MLFLRAGIAVALVLRDSANTVVGGVVAFIIWDWLVVDLLWVSEELRGQGHGSLLMAEIEKRAIELGCKNSRLDTFDFEAKDFYLKCGYQVYSSLKGFPRGHTQFHMQKKLQDA
jgi:GNAT superfamily N-acetyltransferase